MKKKICKDQSRSSFRVAMEQFIKDPKYAGLEKEKENERQATRYYVHVQVEITKRGL